MKFGRINALHSFVLTTNVCPSISSMWTRINLTGIFKQINLLSGIIGSEHFNNGLPTMSNYNLHLTHPRHPKVAVSVSEKIRARLLAAKARFHANDNIADFVQEGELNQLLEEVECKIVGVLDSLVIDTENDHNTKETARRVAKMYIQEIFNGRYVRQPQITEFPNASKLNELMIVGPITVRSACSHHLCPVIGKVWVGVLPNENTNIIGLSKYARLTEWIMGRPQIQEEAVVQLADLIEQKTQPDGLAIVMEATHFCMTWRGVKDMDNKMINSVMRGSFLTNPELRKEFLSLIPR